MQSYFTETKTSKASLESFTSAFEPSIAIKAYVERISKYLHCSYEAYICGMCLLERVERCTGVQITPLNAHRLMLIAMRVSTKFLDDKHYTNAYFAKIGGVTTKEFNQLEMAFLQAIDYCLFVDSSDFQRMSVLVEQGKIMKPMTSIPLVISSVLISIDSSLCVHHKSFDCNDQEEDYMKIRDVACDELEATANRVFSSVFDFENIE